MKVPLNTLTLENLKRGDVITNFEENNEIINDFTTFEADILVKEAKHDKVVPVVTNGFQSTLFFGNFQSECTIENILGEIDAAGKLVKKKVLKEHAHAKVIITCQQTIPRSKYEFDHLLGSFLMKYQGHIWAYGKVLRYKKSDIK
jgi:translation elongation factor EF-1alpha